VLGHLYHLAQQKLRYEIFKNRSRNAQKQLYFDLKIANFFSGPEPHGLRCKAPRPRVGFSKLFLLWPSSLSKFPGTLLATRKCERALMISYLHVTIPSLVEIFPSLNARYSVFQISMQVVMNRLVFPRKPWKNLAQILFVIFEKNAKTA